MRHSLVVGSSRSPYVTLALALFFGAAGTMHFVVPRAYVSIVPRPLPHPVALVIVSGACEIAGGLGLLLPRLRRPAGIGLIALLVAVFPANVQMLLDARSHRAAWWIETLLWMRLPLQPLLMACIWHVMRSDRSAS